MARIHGWKTGVCILVAAAVFPACTAEVSGPEDMAGLETVDETKLELHEDTCWTHAPPHAVVTAGPVPPGWGSVTVMARSPDASYTAPGCPNQWIVEVNGIANRAFDPGGEIPGFRSAQSETACEGYWGIVKTKGFRRTLCTPPNRNCGVWEDLSTRTLRALWLPSWPAPWACEMWESSPTAVLVGANHPYSKIRVVMQAGWALSFVPVNAGAHVY